MNTPCKQFVQYITTLAPKYDKQAVEDDASSKFKLTKDRKVYHNEYFAVRFCYSKFSTDSFSNTVLSLSSLEKYDKIPFFVVLVRQHADNLILMANTTLLRRISHSSQALSMTNIRGSFNGSDIIRSYAGKPNSPDNFDFLFALHQGLDWEDNLSRLVDASARIKPTNQRFCPSSDETDQILKSVHKALEFVVSANFTILEDDLNERCNRVKKELLIASHIDNTNIRGRLIESLITSSNEEREAILESLHSMEAALPTYDTRNGLGDYCREFDNADTYTDIKTKVIYLNSNPKAYNIDKFLKQMSKPKSVFLFFFIGIDEDSTVKTRLCSVFHEKLMENTILQHHWAGRNSRGVAQFNGSAIDEILKDRDFKNKIAVEKAEKFLTGLLER